MLLKVLFKIYYKLLIIQHCVVQINTVRIGFINGIELSSSTTISSEINGSCMKCVCMMISTTNIFGFNCIGNQTCMLFDNDSGEFIYTDSPNSTFYFQRLPTRLSYAINGTNGTTTTIETLAMTSTTITSTTTISTTTNIGTTTCAAPNSGNLMTKSGSIGWTLYTFNYTATKPFPVLSFAIHGGPAGEVVYVDNVSVVNMNAPFTQLLSNPSFEESVPEPTNWVRWCTSSCAAAGDGTYVTNTSCHDSSGIYCITGKCKTGYDYLGQSFSAIIGDSYIISFWLYKTGGGAGTFYANIQ